MRRHIFESLTVALLEGLDNWVKITIYSWKQAWYVLKVEQGFFHVYNFIVTLLNLSKKKREKETTTEQTTTETVSIQKPLAELGDPNLVLVKNDQGDIVVKKREWNAEHKEIVDSLDVEDETDASKKRTMVSTMDFFTQSFN